MKTKELAKLCEQGAEFKFDSENRCLVECLVSCPICGGQGNRFDKSKCKLCNGKGKIYATPYIANQAKYKIKRSWWPWRKGN